MIERRLTLDHVAVLVLDVEVQVVRPFCAVRRETERRPAVLIDGRLHLDARLEHAVRPVHLDVRPDQRAGAVARGELLNGEPHDGRDVELRADDGVARIERLCLDRERRERRLLRAVAVDKPALPGARGVVAEDEPDEHLHRRECGGGNRSPAPCTPPVRRRHASGLARLRLESVFSDPEVDALPNHLWRSFENCGSCVRWTFGYRAFCIGPAPSTEYG